MNVYLCKWSMTTRFLVRTPIPLHNNKINTNTLCFSACVRAYVRTYVTDITASINHRMFYFTKNINPDCLFWSISIIFMTYWSIYSVYLTLRFHVLELLCMMYAVLFCMYYSLCLFTRFNCFYLLCLFSFNKKKELLIYAHHLCFVISFNTLP